MKKTVLLIIPLLFLFVGCDNSTETEACTGVNDIDDNCYQTVQIGEQVWLDENLKVTHYNNGDAISTGYSEVEWDNLLLGAYAIYNDESSNADVYGNLYNWYAVDDSRSICPDGWHVPTDTEFKELELYLGMSEEEANSLIWRGTNEGSKIAGNSELWNDGDLKSDLDFGISGFNALPAGYRTPTPGDYYYKLVGANFWSSSLSDDYDDTIFYDNPYSRRLLSNKSGILRDNPPKAYGFSVRCLQD